MQQRISHGAMGYYLKISEIEEMPAMDIIEQKKWVRLTSSSYQELPVDLTLLYLRTINLIVISNLQANPYIDGPILFGSNVGTFSTVKKVQWANIPCRFL